MLLERLSNVCFVYKICFDANDIIDANVIALKAFAALTVHVFAGNALTAPVADDIAAQGLMPLLPVLLLLMLLLLLLLKLLLLMLLKLLFLLLLMLLSLLMLLKLMLLMMLLLLLLMLLVLILCFC